MTMDSPRGCLGLRSSLGKMPLLHEAESSPDRGPAPRVMHRRCGLLIDLLFALDGRSMLSADRSREARRGSHSGLGPRCVDRRFGKVATAKACSALAGASSPSDGPDEAEGLAGHGGNRDLGQLAARA